MHSSVNERGEPEHTSEIRIVLRDLTKITVRDRSHFAARERTNTVLHLLEQEAVEVHKIAGDVKSRDLPFPISQVLVTGSEALKNEAAVGLCAALGHHLLVRFVDGHPRRDLLEHLLLLIREEAMLFELGNEWM
jgi:hypothetical protein